jgi:hypothetical protein
MDPSKSNEYHYEPLVHEEDIRVLVLQPGRGNESLQCHLKHVSLAKPPPYEALSYVWGDATRKDQIHCDNGTLAVTTNLHIALRYLRNEVTERVIWADAICEIDSRTYSRIY